MRMPGSPGISPLRMDPDQSSGSEWSELRISLAFLPPGLPGVLAGKNLSTRTRPVRGMATFF